MAAAAPAAEPHSGAAPSMSSFLAQTAGHPGRDPAVWHARRARGCAAVALALAGAFFVFGARQWEPAGAAVEDSEPFASAISAPEASSEAEAATVAHSSSVRASARGAELKGMYETINARETVWQIPETRPLQGVAFFAHGCTHKAPHFWPKTLSCPGCIGLPEDKALVAEALARGYAVIAVSSFGVCWEASWPHYESTDARDVVEVLRIWTKEHGLEKERLVALGASSGGYFISILAHAVQLEAQAILISSGVKEAFDVEPDSDPPYPPTLFVHMPKDKVTARHVHWAIAGLRANGVHATEISCAAMLVSDSFLSDRIESLDGAASAKIVGALREAGLISARGYLTREIRGRWQDVYGKTGVLVGAEPYLEAQIDEELNLAHAYHEMTSEFASEIMDWFDGVCPHAGSPKATGGRCESYPSQV